MSKYLTPGGRALIVHGRIPGLTGESCTLVRRVDGVSYDYARTMGTFAAWDVVFDSGAFVDDSGRVCSSGLVPEIYLVPYPGVYAQSIKTCDEICGFSR